MICCSRRNKKLFQLNEIFNGKCDIIVEKAFPSSFHSISLDFSISQLHLSTKLSVKLPVCKVCCQNLLLLVTNLKAICLKWPSRSDSQLTSWLAVYASFLSLSLCLSLHSLWFFLSLCLLLEVLDWQPLPLLAAINQLKQLARAKLKYLKAKWSGEEFYVSRNRLAPAKKTQL